ncbi:hypothetical protein JTE90_003785 [Oedothorax gibbosus]|uniref:Cytochrome c oxidase subunit 4 n=1 Tax=Oedothorax gibbosus TaxID=931172 RepID=A0AAV6VB68_9ARAC|nr:hypothetical protein JTE90_003785 [Oedothorax gibbosus]
MVSPTSVPSSTSFTAGGQNRETSVQIKLKAINGKWTLQLTSSPSFVHDAEEEQQPSIATSNTGFELQNLKQREKGDWKKLTLEEKQALYRMSFSQPFHVLDQPANEWKLILAGTFTAMGLTALAMYMWTSQFEKTEEVIGPLSTKKKDAEASLFYGNDLAEKSV